MKSSERTTPGKRFALGAGLLLVLSFSFGWVWLVGHRGLYLFDESIMFDGAWRIVQGQTVYRDFFIPFGPVAFFWQALIFRVAGVSVSSMVLAAATLSVLCTAVVVRLTWRLSSGSAVLSLASGALTAVWYQAPFGIPWMEQTAFFLNFCALLAIVEGRLRARPSGLLFAAAGLVSLASVLSKQNAGGFFVIVCLGALCVPATGRGKAALKSILQYAAGALVGALAFLLWLWRYSDVHTFLHYWLGVSSELGLSRISYDRLLGALFYQPLTGSTVVLFAFSSLLGVAALWLGRALNLRGRPLPEQFWLCGWLAIALPQFQSLFQTTTFNESTNNNAQVGLCVACALALGLHFPWRELSLGWERADRAVSMNLLGERLRRVAPVFVTIVVLMSTVEGLVVAYSRTVQEFADGTTFAHHLDVKGAERVRWGEPTYTRANFCQGAASVCEISPQPNAEHQALDVLRRQDFERVVRTLQERRENFFVFPDSTLLYGLAGRVSPQPLLYFHPGQSFSKADVGRLDAMIVASLEKHQVSLVVLERASFLGTQRRLSLFPKLEHWIRDHFQVSEEFGNYQLLARQRSALTGL